MARALALGGFGLSRGINPDAMRNSEPDEDDEDGSDDLDALAAGLGVDGRKLRVALMAAVQAQAALSEDGKQLRFEATSAPGTEVLSVILANSTPVAIQVMAADVGYFAREIEFDVDGIGTNDNATVVLNVTGHQPIPERFLIGAEGLTLRWGRPLVQGAQFTVTAPHATAGASIGLFAVARGSIPSEEDVRSHAKAYRQAAPDKHRLAAKKKRNKHEKRARSAAVGAVGALSAVGGKGRAVGGGPGGMGGGGRGGPFGGGGGSFGGGGGVGGGGGGPFGR